MRCHDDIEDHVVNKRVKSDGLLGIGGLCLVEQFISRQEELTLLQHIDAMPWNTSLRRRTQHYGFLYDYSTKKTLSSAPSLEVPSLPTWADFLWQRLMDQKHLFFAPDQMIVNEYEAGQGIAAHVDNVTQFEDGIVSVSLASDIVMQFCKKKQNKRKQKKSEEKEEEEKEEQEKELWLPRCSALILHGESRYEWKHGIAARKQDHGKPRQRRVSITFRRMKRTPQ